MTQPARTMMHSPSDASGSGADRLSAGADAEYDAGSATPMPPPPKLKTSPYYSTRLGAAYLGDSRDLIKQVPDASVQAIITSPPYALRAKKKYGNASQDEYVEWFLGFVDDFVRVLKPDGSLVIEIGGAWKRVGERAGDYIALEIDSPLFPALFRPALFQADDEGRTFRLAWKRPRAREDRG